MSRRGESNREERRPQRGGVPALPETLRLKNMTNHQEQSELSLMRSRIQALEGKVTELESKVRVKQRRIRRPSWQVEKKYRCEECGRKYGTLVALNLHLRIKHQKEKQHEEEEEDSQSEEHSEDREETPPVRPALKKKESPHGSSRSLRSKSDSA